jgi:cytochrome c oxidase subunit 2
MDPSKLALPPQASTFAQNVDPLFNFLVIASSVFLFIVLAGIIVFSLKYRKRKGYVQQSTSPTQHALLEIAWIGIPLILVMITFVWGYKGYLKMGVAPKDALEIKVTAQQWFWSFDYPDGTSSVNELVVPIGVPVKLLMSSKDVIHSFFVPAFRLKRDVLPNRYTIAWFQTTQVGEYDLFCAEYCGTKHSEMTGKVRVVSESEYQKWLETSAAAGEGITPAEYGAKLYKSKACNTCHSTDGSPGNGPTFKNVFGHEVKFNDGTSQIADENYIRQSILDPRAKIVLGFAPIMPTYQGLLKSRDIDALIAYIKSLSDAGK